MEQTTSSYWDIVEASLLNDLEERAHTEVLVAGSRLDQSGIRAAVDAVFDANPTLGAVFEPNMESWLARPGGGWSWAVEPPGVTVDEVITRQRAGYDKRTGRLFAVSLLPGAPERLVLTASRLCVDETLWQSVVDGVRMAYVGADLAPDATYRAKSRAARSWAWWRADRRPQSQRALAA